MKKDKEFKQLTTIKKIKDGKWVVSQVVETYNHPLTTPSKIHNYQSHRNDQKYAFSGNRDKSYNDFNDR